MHLLYIIVSTVLLTVIGYHLPLSKCTLNRWSTSEFVHFLWRCLSDSVVFGAVQIVKNVVLKTMMALESADIV